MRTYSASVDGNLRVDPHARCDTTHGHRDGHGPGRGRRGGIRAVGGDGERVDAVGLPRFARAATGVGHELGRDPHEALSSADQEALKRAGDVSAIPERPHPLAAETPRQSKRSVKPRAPTATVFSPYSLPVP